MIAPIYRFSVARPGDPPVEVQSFDNRAAALLFAATERANGRDAETWDWAENRVIDAEVPA